MTIHVVGGVYSELCSRPGWASLAGSGGRAALAISMMKVPAELHSYMTDEAHNDYLAGVHFYGVTVHPTKAETTITFRYLHDLQKPSISERPQALNAPISVQADKVLRFGMLEGDAVVHADWAVFDPQNLGAGTPFGAKGSTAKHLAVIVNDWEARAVADANDKLPEEWARAVADLHSAEVVVMRRGPLGAVVFYEGGATLVPGYRTSNSAFKIGSGDCFVAHFALRWLEEGCDPVTATEHALKAMAYHIENKGTPIPEQLERYEADRVVITPEFHAGEVRQVYLAGPFFTTGQLWFIEELRRSLTAFGLKVFSPFHEIGPGKAHVVVPKDLQGVRDSHLVLAVADGFDPGTVYEVGFARALGKRVIVLKESESFEEPPAKLPEELKMFEGDDCLICLDYTHAVYTTLWEAAAWEKAS